MVTWRNFRFQYMTDVEKSEISPHVEEFQISQLVDECLISPHDRWGDIRMATNIKLLLFLDRCPGGYNLWRCYSAQMIGFGKKYFVVTGYRFHVCLVL